jgi:hypothetical protein
MITIKIIIPLTFLTSCIPLAAGYSGQIMNLRKQAAAVSALEAAQPHIERGVEYIKEKKEELGTKIRETTMPYEIEIAKRGCRFFGLPENCYERNN